MTDLYIDIETIPGQREGVREEIAANITPPGNVSKPETIAKWEAEKKPGAVEKAWRDTSFNGTLGEIICISFAVDEGKPVTVHRELHELESDMLKQSLASISKELGPRKPVWVGHYITGFDLRFIWQRCVINKVMPPLLIPYQAKPWDANIFDTKTEWSGPSGGNSSSSLGAVCKAFGIEGKGDIDGSKVWGYVKAGRVREVATYCAEDVERTRQLHRRMTFMDTSKTQEAAE